MECSLSGKKDRKKGRSPCLMGRDEDMCSKLISDRCPEENVSWKVWWNVESQHPL
jgi:hypothetical protein